MSWRATALVKQCRLRSPIRKAVMLVVADFCSERADALGVDVPEGWSVCWAGVQSIADDAEVDERTVKRVLADMREPGLIRTTRRHDPRTGYRLDDAVWLELNRQPLVLPVGWESSRELADRLAREARTGRRVQGDTASLRTTV